MTTINDVIDRILLRVAELPGRSSPEDQPEMMLVSDTELREILTEELHASSEGANTNG